MSDVTLSLKLQGVLSKLDEIDDVFAEFSDVEQTLQWQARVDKLRKDTLKEISRLDRQALNDWQAALTPVTMGAES